jgi:hypothetical protein
MPSIDISFLNKLKENFRHYPLFIETGTYIGETIFNLEPYFDKLYTIELSEYFYNNTKSKYNGNKITFINGDSSKVLSELLTTINKSCIFFLDGHFSSCGTAKGDKDVPLYEEIISIKDNCNYNSIIIIDDCRLFGTSGPEDWSDINIDKILNILSDRIENYYFLDSEISKNDRLIISIKMKDN